eukprot:481286-Hanusia_phi.AAC.1
MRKWRGRGLTEETMTVVGAVKCDGWDEIMTATSSVGQEEDMDSSIRFLEKEEATNSQGGEREGSKQRVLLRPNPVYPSRQNEASKLRQ